MLPVAAALLASALLAALAAGFARSRRVFDGVLLGAEFGFRSADLLLSLLCALLGGLRQLLAFQATRKLLRRLLGLAPAQPPKRPRVVVLGASFAGLEAMRRLRDRFEVTLVDFKTYFEYTPGVLRCLVQPAHFAALSVPLRPVRAKLEVAEVIAVSDTVVTLRKRDGIEGACVPLAFDYLVISLGSTYTAPIKPRLHERDAAERADAWDAAADRLRGADSVLIVGGGPTGVELAAEIVDAYPKMRVTLIEGGPALLASMPPAAGAAALTWLTARGCAVRLGERIARITGSGVELVSGEEVSADVVYPMLGFASNVEPMRRGGLAGPSDAALHVNDHLQLPRSPNIFAAGDVMRHAASAEVKVGHTADMNAILVAANVARLHDKRPLLSYPDGVVGAGYRTPRLFCVSLGRYDALLVFNSILLRGRLPAAVKWLVEFTKVRAAAESRIAIGFWMLGDAATVALNRLLPGEPAPAPAKPKQG